MSTFIAGHVYSLKEDYKETFSFSDKLHTLDIFDGERFTIKATEVDQYGNMMNNGIVVAERNQRYMFKDKGLDYEFVSGKTYRLKSKFQEQVDAIADIFNLDVDTNEPLQFKVSCVIEGAVFGTLSIGGTTAAGCVALAVERHMFYEIPEA